MRAEKEEGGFGGLGRKRVVNETRRRLTVPELLLAIHYYAFQKLLVGFPRTKS